MSGNAMPAFNPLDPIYSYPFNSGVEVVAVNFLKDNSNPPTRVISKNDYRIVLTLQTDFGWQIDVLMCRIDNNGSSLDDPVQTAMIKFAPLSDDTCRADLHVARFASPFEKRVLDGVWADLLAGWKLRALTSANEQTIQPTETHSASDGAVGMTPATTPQINRQPVRRRGTGKPPKTKADKIAAIQEWDSLERDSRMPLTDWLEVQFGTEPDGSLSVRESTFHGWRKLIADS